MCQLLEYTWECECRVYIWSWCKHVTAEEKDPLLAASGCQSTQTDESRRKPTPKLKRSCCDTSCCQKKIDAALAENDISVEATGSAIDANSDDREIRNQINKKLRRCVNEHMTGCVPRLLSSGGARYLKKKYAYQDQGGTDFARRRFQETVVLNLDRFGPHRLQIPKALLDTHTDEDQELQRKAEVCFRLQVMTENTVTGN